jgi:hypothetical protein
MTTRLIYIEAREEGETNVVAEEKAIKYFEEQERVTHGNRKSDRLDEIQMKYPKYAGDKINTILLNFVIKLGEVGSSQPQKKGEDSDLEEMTGFKISE